MMALQRVSVPTTGEIVNAVKAILRVVCFGLVGLFFPSLFNGTRTSSNCSFLNIDTLRK